MKPRARRLVLWCVAGGSCLLLLAFGVSQLANKAEAPDGEPTDAYDFPIKPGTDAWAQFQSHQEMLDACQVPDDVLRTMSTRGLVETALSYPLYGEYGAYSSFQYGFDQVAAGFNGLREFLSRADAGAELIARYRAMDPAAIGQGWTSLQRGQYAARFSDIEILIAQDAILGKLTGAERRALIEEALHKIEAKQTGADVYGESGRQSSAFVLGRILEQEAVPAFQAMVERDAMLRLFLSDGSASSPEIHDDIIRQANEFLSSTGTASP